MDIPAPPGEAPPAPLSVADGVPRSLDPRLVQLDRIAGFVFTSFLSGALFIAALIAWLAAGMPAILLLLWPAVTGLLLWFSYAWPPVDFRHRSYRVDARGIEIRHGVFWRSVENVPRSRVQHIDVSQGPIERRFGLGSLKIYTAGTDYALVALRGVTHSRALLIRDHLLPGESQDAV
jgi:membrane protein YdbS with pleckstrin-like domain